MLHTPPTAGESSKDNTSSIEEIASRPTYNAASGCSQPKVRSAPAGRRAEVLLSSASHPSLIIYAWAIEIVGVSCGVLNSTYTTFGQNLPNSVWEYVPALPMAVVALAELGRVPLASAFFSKNRPTKVLAILAISALSCLAIENWTFGFER